ncbi:hypothetical protein [Citrobacter sp. MGH106]|uniref:hypothetical protein n=1 Tax=Citrobacter sp. MGH106 TaxID=1686381 RepID=UPI0006511C74|nr:hypothetical protein [Citrobacter sp. MGH106]KLV66285.1 hypothetical protein SK36_00994 [Citrobacter sp. MGH106]
MTSREKFEAWYLENWGHTEDDHETMFERDPDSDEEYYRLGVRMAHGAWQASELASQQKLTDIAVQLANAESKCRELAAENEKRNMHSEALAVDNAALREVVERMVNQFAMSGISPEEKSINPAKSLMFDAKSALFMPTTDAFLAEVRARALDEFAIAQDEQAKKYYELSPGCSGQNECQYAAGQAWYSAECIRKSAAQLRKGAAL